MEEETRAIGVGSSWQEMKTNWPATHYRVYKRRVKVCKVKGRTHGIYVPGSERSIQAFNKNLCIFIPFGATAVKKRAHKLNLRRIRQRGGEKHEEYIATLDTGIIYDRP